MGNIALPGSGEEDLCSGIRIFFQQEDTMQGMGSMECTEQPGRACTDHHNVMLFHEISEENIRSTFV